ncbi:MAG: efflux RND transporter periplasmic adaptor subunit [Fibrella sp.]|nr:efflux RND transporter periplasmic adaptor subunit [Armatimonadota bacterium]
MKVKWERFGVAAALSILLAASAPVYAHGGEDHSGGTATVTTAAGATMIPETQFELEIIDTAANDPLLGSEVPLENAAVKATMKHGDEAVLNEAAHQEGEGTGVYGVHAILDENGAHTMRWEITPKTGAAFTADFPVAVAGVPERSSATGLLSGWRLPAAIAGGAVLLGVMFALGRASSGGSKKGQAVAARAAMTLFLALSLAGGNPVWSHGGEDHGTPGGTPNAATGSFADLKVGVGDITTATQTKKVGTYKVTLTVLVIKPKPADPNQIRLTEAQSKTIGIQTVPVSGGRFDTGVSVTGTVAPDPARQVTLSSRVAGRLTSVVANIGDRVRAGQALATIQSPEIAGAQGTYTAATGEVLSREAAYRQSQERVRIAERQLSQQKELARAGVFSQAPLQQARTAQSEAASELATVRAALAEARSQLAQAEADRATHRLSLARVKELFEVGIRSRAEYEAQQLEVSLDNARVTQAEALIRQQQARVGQAETRVGLAGQAVAREKRLAGSGVLTRREIVQSQGVLDTARLQATQTQAELNAARRAVESARASLSAVGATPGGGNSVTLTASINGIIAEREAAVGEAVGPDKTLFTLLNPSVVVVEGDVFEQDLPQVRAGIPVRITTDAAPGKTFNGRIANISTTVNPETRSARARITISNPSGVLRPGTFVRALLVTDPRPQTVTVPDAAVQSEAGLKVVYIKSGNTFVRREVAVGESAGGRTQIKSGVKPGEQVVTTGAYQLRAISRGS